MVVLALVADAIEVAEAETTAVVAVVVAAEEEVEGVVL